MLFSQQINYYASLGFLISAIIILSLFGIFKLTGKFIWGEGVAYYTFNGELRECFSGRTLDMFIPKENFAKQGIEHSRKNYARPLQEVKDILEQWEEGKFDPKADPKKKSTSSLDEEVEFQEPIV